MSTPTPTDVAPRQPCPYCAEPIALEARLCHHCQSSVLVDVVLVVAVTDARARYQLARTVQAIPGAPPITQIQAGLASPRPSVARGVTRAFAHEVVARLAAVGVRAAIETPAPVETRSSSAGRPLAWAAAVAVVAALGALGWRLGARRPSVEAPPSAPVAPVRAALPEGLSSRDLAQRSLPSTVSLRCRNSVGSGFFVAPDLVLTNAHVLCGGEGETIEVTLSDDRKLTGRAERANPDIDLGLVRVSGAHEPVLRLGDVADLAAGDKVMIIGSPIGLDFTVHEGSVSSLQRSTRGVAYVQLDAKVNPGNSGGPVIDSLGRVVGIVSLKVVSAEGISLALPINYAYSPNLRFVPPPAPEALASTTFQKMVARAVAEAATSTRAPGALESAPPDLREGGPLLVHADVDPYQRLVVRILRVSDTLPRFEEIAVTVWHKGQQFCTMKGDITTWRRVGPEDAAAVVPADVRLALGARAIWVGESPLRWDLCNRDLMVSGIQIELVGGNPSRNRLQLGR